MFSYFVFRVFEEPPVVPHLRFDENQEQEALYEVPDQVAGGDHGARLSLQFKRLLTD